MSSLQQKLFAAFEGEYRSILESIRSTIVKVEASGEELGGTPLTDAFRMAHTLKGSAHVVGLADVVTVAHCLESLFAKVRDGKVRLGKDELRLILASLDMIEDVVLSSQKGAAAPAIQGIVQSIGAMLNGSPAPKTEAARPTLVAVPMPASAGATAVDKVVDKTVESVVFASAAESDTVRLSARHLDQLLATSGELLTMMRGSRQIDQRISLIGGHLESITREWDLLRRTSLGAIQAMGHTPEYSRVAQFLDFVGTQLVPLNKNVRAAKAATKQTEWDLQHLGEQLQEDVRKARIVPAETILGGFHKMVRDLSSQLDRPLDFRFSGLEVEADRSVLQQLKDPLMHMLRNSVDHGIENKAERQSAGKPEIGKLSVRLTTANGRLSVLIEDDGQGLPEPKIRERIISQGFLSEADAASLPSARVFEFIFRPGFSTAKEISDISGRGMGMSIVDEMIKKLQGTIQVESEPGRGSKFTISVPITLTNHHLVLVHYGELTYAVPCTNIESLHRVKKTDLKVVDGHPSILVNEKPTQVVSLGTLLETSQEAVQLIDETLSIVVLKCDGRFLALAVDSVSDKCEALIKNLAPQLQRQKVFSGAMLLGDGSVALVLDPRTLISKGSRSSTLETHDAPIKVNTGVMKTATTKILVVDDSITTRTLERGILEAHGFEVSLAVDGMDALARVQVEHFDLVISDVEMPRMDGFTLVAEIKKNPKLAHIPIIMVTSLEKSEHRERGLSLGASAYVAKQKFDQGALLETIRQIL